MPYEIVIGLEVHAELSTKSKIFCGCTTAFGGDTNTHTCPICTGMPGTLPVLNKKVVEYAVKAGLATNCDIAEFSKQDRKNYFYPDLPKAYQISQYDLPLCQNGHLEIQVDGESKRIGITRIHIEEDAGKLLHDQDPTSTLIDYNRCGVPLIEIVSEPDIRSADEAKAYVEHLKAILEYIEVSDCKMQEGSLRADVNLSVRPIGAKIFGTRTEMKNLNSFRSIVRAIEAESQRQINELENGGTIMQETRRWDDTKGYSYPMRSKEEAHDYRYFPDPDLIPIVVDNSWLKELQAQLPELPDKRRYRYIHDYDLPSYDAYILTSSKELSNFFEEAVHHCHQPKAVSNWIMGDLMRRLNDRNLEMDQIPFPAQHLASLIQLIDSGKINTTIGKKVFEIMFDSGKKAEEIVKEEGLEMVNDEAIILLKVEKVLAANQKSVADFKNGKQQAFGFLVGQTMKELKGKADPQMIHTLLRSALET